VIFDDESIVQGYSSLSEGTSVKDEVEVNSLRDSELMENSQPESQVITNYCGLFSLAITITTRYLLT